MTKNYKIIAQFIKDMSSETPNVETYMHVKDNISKYQLGINIDSRAIKNKIIEVDTKISYLDKEENTKKSIFEFIYTSIVKVDEKIKERNILEKIVLVEVQKLQLTVKDVIFVAYNTVTFLFQYVFIIPEGDV